MKWILVFCILGANTAVASRCNEMGGQAAEITKLHSSVKSEILKICGPASCKDSDVNKAVVKGFQKYFSKSAAFGRKAASYIAILGVIVLLKEGSLQFNHYLGTDYPRIASLIADIATFSLVFIGAPIFVPLQAMLSKNSYLLQGKDKEFSVSALNKLFLSTQQNYSLNEQNGRDTIIQFQVYAHQKLESARNAHNKGDFQFAARQLALLARELRTLFAEIPAHDKFVTDTVRGTFLVDINDVSGIDARILEHLKQVDSDYSKDNVEVFYKKLVETWFE